MQENNLIACSNINVDCVRNDPVDVRAGGPEFLGFDFAVEENKASEMIEFITDTLNDLTIPIAYIGISGTIYKSAKDVWTQEKIYKEIVSYSDYLHEEEMRNYQAPKKRKKL